jgi:hypothetical protein
MTLSPQTIEALADAIAARLHGAAREDGGAARPQADVTPYPDLQTPASVSRRGAFAGVAAVVGAAVAIRPGKATAAVGEENIALAAIATNTLNTFNQVTQVYRNTKDIAEDWDKYVQNFNTFMQHAENMRDNVKAFASVENNPILKDARYLRDYVNTFLMWNDDMFKFRIKKLNFQSQAIVRFVDGFVSGLDTIWDEARDLAKKAGKGGNPSEEEVMKMPPARVATRIGQSVSIAGQGEIQAAETRQNARTLYAQLQKDHAKRPDSTRTAGEIFTDNAGMMQVDLLANISEQLSQVVYALNTQTMVLLQKKPPVGPDEGRVTKEELGKSLESLKQGYKRRDRKDKPPRDGGTT